MGVVKVGVETGTALAPMHENTGPLCVVVRMQLAEPAVKPLFAVLSVTSFQDSIWRVDLRRTAYYNLCTGSIGDTSIGGPSNWTPNRRRVCDYEVRHELRGATEEARAVSYGPPPRITGHVSLMIGVIVNGPARLRRQERRSHGPQRTHDSSWC